MKNTTQKKIVIASVLLLILSIGAILYFYKKDNNTVSSFEECRRAGYPILESYPEQCKTPDGKTFINSSEQATPTNPDTGNGVSTPLGNDEIKIYGLTSGQVIQSPIIIQGEAKGWYFEASFPVQLVDANGKILFQGPATAQSDWMTSAFVPFKITVTFANPSTATGTLIFKNDNPSGLPENERSFKVPVRFDVNKNQRSVNLYYYNSSLDKDIVGNILCSTKGLVSVQRSIPITQTPLQDTLRLFLKGEITSSEKNSGISSEYPLSGVELKSAFISNTGVLTIDLADPKNRTSGGSCRVKVLQAQLEATAKQFTNVKSIVYTKPVFQP